MPQINNLKIPTWVAEEVWTMKLFSEIKKNKIKYIYIYIIFQICLNVMGNLF